MTLPRLAPLVAGAALAGCVVLALLWRGAERDVGARDALIRARDRAIAVGWDSAAAWDRRGQVDTVRLAGAVTSYRRLRDSLVLRDSVAVRDSLVIRTVEAADSTIAACSVAVTDCAARADAWRAVADSERAQIAALQRARRGCRVLLGLIPCPRPGVAVGLGDDGRPHTVVGLTLAF